MWQIARHEAPQPGPPFLAILDILATVGDTVARLRPRCAKEAISAAVFRGRDAMEPTVDLSLIPMRRTHGLAAHAPEKPWVATAVVDTITVM
jgi:hypothetical protein